MILISVLIPTYNSSKYISSCLNSVIYQTYSNLEILLADGGSTDDTKKIIKQYCLNDKRIKLFQTTKGVSIQRNFLIEQAKGDYLFFLDSDDVLEKRCLEVLLMYSLKNEYDLVAPNVKWVIYDNDTCINLIERFQSNKILSLNIDNYLGYMHFLLLPQVFKLYKKSLIDKIRFDEKISFGEDLLFNLKIVEHNDLRYFICYDALYYYRYNAVNKYKYTDVKYFGYFRKWYFYIFSDKYNINFSKFIFFYNEICSFLNDYKSKKEKIPKELLFYKKECIKYEKQINIFKKNRSFYTFDVCIRIVHKIKRMIVHIFFPNIY